MAHAASPRHAPPTCAERSSPTQEVLAGFGMNYRLSRSSYAYSAAGNISVSERNRTCSLAQKNALRSPRPMPDWFLVAKRYFARRLDM
jgi:hypothetical protein